MNARTLTVGILAVVCGLSAMVLVQAMRKPPAAPEVDKITAVYAATDVKPGETIQEDMLEVREVPKGEIPEDALSKSADAVGRAAMAPLDKGDLIREKKLAERGAGRGMAALIKTGMRAFTIQTPSFSSSLAGFILPGNKVDVLLTINSQGVSEDETGGASTTTLLENVEILAVHTTVNTPTANKIDPDQARSVTLLVTPDEASLLDLGQNKGTLHLSLRNLKDSGAVKPKPTMMSDLPFSKNAKPKLPPVERPAPPVVIPVIPPEPEFVEVRLRVRTMRGTSHGEDVVTYLRPSTPGSRASGNPRPRGFPSSLAGPPP